MALSAVDSQGSDMASAQSNNNDSPAAAGASRPGIMKPGGLLARRRSRNSASTSSTSTVTFDLALEIPHRQQQFLNDDEQIGDSNDCENEAVRPYLSRSNSTRQVHSIEQDSQLIVRQCFKLALIGDRLTAEQVEQMAEVIDNGDIQFERNLAVNERSKHCLLVAATMFNLTTELRSTRHGFAIVRRVQQVSLHSLSRSEFERHVIELSKQHRPGDSRAQCASILLFCIELALTAAECSDRLAFCQVLNWSLNYFRRTVSARVVRAGGWDNVIREPSKVVSSIAFFLSVLLFGRAILRLIKGC